MPDVIIVGAGSMGSAAAYALARRGASVVALDRFTPPHTRGAHAGGSRIIRMTYAEGPAYVPLLRRTYALWEALDPTLVTPTGGLNIGRPGSGTVAGALESAVAYGLDHEVLDASALRRRFPAFTPAADEVAVYDVAAGIVEPERAIATLLSRAASLGASFRFGTSAESWSTSDSGVSVVLSDGSTLSADRLVLAPGGWAPGLLGFPVPLRVSRRIQHYWASPGPAYEPSAFPVWIWESGEGIGYGMPAFGAEGWVKAAFHHGDEPASPAEGVRPYAPGEEEPVRSWLADRIPGLSRHVGAKECMYTLTPDENFLIGAHPSDSRVVVAAGFSGHGFKFVPVVGEILASLALDGTCDFDLTPFSPGRFS
ncbi:N-methyl-L-tryptophan oxidase [Hamadaea tsunoensis]|uniref:N-methyl-L-tryptophan oxidase n=1 Tax=Hamadaea tsunoensis TaxID=53368 RepID=UPI000408A085|nr:N-methyl-L-tryptophan oxidase [Hamadaea tsunoensis]